MHSVLFWKEWRQLALVRWGGIALGAVLPIAFTVGAELAQRGLLPTGRVRAYATRDLMYELLPAALALGLWPLIALMSAAQAFSGDRAAGTESFLLERPVPRPAVWRARFFASIATVMIVVVGTGLLAAMSARLTSAPPAIGWSRWTILASLGIGIALLAYLGGLTAGSLLVAPLGAVLLGAVIGSTPPLLLAQLVTLFPYARVGAIELGAVLPALLPPAFIAASWVAFCVGEPAGRGRIRRAAIVVASTLAGILILFAGAAPIVMRVNANGGQHYVVAAPSGGHAFVGAIGPAGWSGGWIVDTAAGARRAFVPPPVHEVAWSPDGSELAVVTWSGPMGSVRSQERIDVRSARDGSVLRSLRSPDEENVASMVWAEGGLAAIVTQDLPHDGSRHEQSLEVVIVDPTSGERHPTGFRSNGWTLRIVGTGPGGHSFVREVVEDPSPGKIPSPRGYRLHPLDVAHGTVGPPLVDSAGRELTFAGWNGGLSPSGRFGFIVGDDGSVRAQTLDLGVTAQPAPPEAPAWAAWAAGDRLVWCENLGHRTRLFASAPGVPPRALREWSDAQVGVEPSEDGRSIFVSVIPAGGAPTTDTSRRSPDPAGFESAVPAGQNPEEIVYLSAEDRFVSLGAPFSDRANDLRYTQWAGSGTLARIAPGVVVFEDLAAPGRRRFVIGGPRKLE